MSPSDAWDPDQYARFASERARPFDDLLAMVQPTPAPRVVDLGCGTGELTSRLHLALDARETVGIDRSESMLSQGAEARAGVTGLRCERGEIADVAALHHPGFGAHSVDVVFSNAALHWLDDHATLLAQLSKLLKPGGQLAVQVPHMHRAPTFRAAVEIAQSPPFRDALGGFVQRYGVVDVATYSRLLHKLGFAEQRVRLEVYAHELPSREAVFEWVKGSTLTPYRERLPPKVYDAFLGRYRERLMLSLVDERPYLFPFERILFWARLPR